MTDVAVLCAVCRGRLRSAFDTDGDGALVELVDPCSRCAPRAGSRFRLKPAAPAAKAASVRAFPCRACAEPIPCRSRGRPPLYHKACKPPRRSP